MSVIVKQMDLFKNIVSTVESPKTDTSKKRIEYQEGFSEGARMMFEAIAKVLMGTPEAQPDTSIHMNNNKGG